MKSDGIQLAASVYFSLLASIGLNWILNYNALSFGLNILYGVAVFFILWGALVAYRLAGRFQGYDYDYQNTDKKTKMTIVVFYLRREGQKFPLEGEEGVRKVIMEYYVFSLAWVLAFVCLGIIGFKMVNVSGRDKNSLEEIQLRITSIDSLLNLKIEEKRNTVKYQDTIEWMQGQINRQQVEIDSLRKMIPQTGQTPLHVPIRR